MQQKYENSNYNVACNKRIVPAAHNEFLRLAGVY